MELYNSYKYCKLFGDTTRASRYFNEKLALNRESSNNINRMNKHNSYRNGFLFAGKMVDITNDDNFMDREFVRGYLQGVVIFRKFITEERYNSDKEEFRNYTFDQLFGINMVDKNNKSNQKEIGYKCGILGYNLDEIKEMHNNIDSEVYRSGSFAIGYTQGLFTLGYLYGFMRDGLKFVFDQEKPPADWLRGNKYFLNGIEYAGSVVNQLNADEKKHSR